MNEKACLNELVINLLEFEGYTFDRLNNKLVEVFINVSYMFSHVEVTFATINFQNKPVVTTIEEPKSIKRRTNFAIISCILHLPIEFVEILVIVVSF